MLYFLQKLWNINRFRITVMAIVPMIGWVMMDRVFPVYTEVIKYAAISWISYAYLGTIFLGIKFGPKVSVRFVGRGKKRRKLITFAGKEHAEIYFARIVELLVALPFVSGLIGNVIDHKNLGLVYCPFLMYHIICFIKDIPLSTIKLLPYVANGNITVTQQQWSATSSNFNDIGDSSYTSYRYTYRY